MVRPQDINISQSIVDSGELGLSEFASFYNVGWHILLDCTPVLLVSLWTNKQHITERRTCADEKYL